MNNLKTLILDPKQYFESKNSVSGKRRPMKLILLLLIYLALQMIKVVVSIQYMNNLLISMGVDLKFLNVITSVAILPIALLKLVIIVNILYIFIKILVEKVEKKQIEDSKYLKNIIYITNILSSIVLSLMTIVSTLVINNHQILIMVNAINAIFAGLISFYLFYNILKFYLKTEKLHKTFPTIVYIINVINSIVIVLEA